MHYKETDLRSIPLRILCTTSSNAIDELIKFSKSGVLDGITAMEYSEYFYGAVLVACQAYAVGTVSDVNEIQESNCKKLDLYEYTESDLHEHTQVELINALANFFKHNEEWILWPNNRTAKTLRYYGIDEKTEFPLNKGVEIILDGSGDLRSLCTVLEDWRFSILNVRCKNT